MSNTALGTHRVHRVNRVHRLGAGNVAATLVAALVAALVVAVAPVVLASSPALAAGSGTVAGWGVDWFGAATSPQGLSNVTRIAAGGFHSLALKADGTVAAWGANDNGESTVPTGLSSVTAIAAGQFHSLALKSDGSVKAWGGVEDTGAATVPAGLSGVTAIAAGAYFSLAVKADGTVTGWGSNTSGQTTPPPGLTHVTAVAGGAEHSLALKDDGTVVGWGDNSFGQATPPPGLMGVTAIAAGAFSSLALKSDGTVVAWGSNEFGERDVPAGLSGVTAIAAGSYHDLALKSDGTVVAWGLNSDGEATVPANLGHALAVAAGESHSLAVIGTSPPTLRSVTVAPTSASVTIGGTVQFAATAHYSDNSARVVTPSATWTSSAPTIATVSAGGLATGHAVGTTTIIATYGGKSSAGASLTVAAQPVTTTVQDTATAVRYGDWYGVDDPSASGGSYRRTAGAGVHAAFTFSGTAITWVTRKGPDQGIATLSIGGKVRGSYDLYASTAQNSVRITLSGLAKGTHTLQVTATGRRDSASTGSNVSVDAFSVGSTTTQDTANRVMWGTWSGASSTGASGGSYRVSSTTGALTTLVFSGTGVDLVTAKGPAYGKAQIAIDGTVRAVLDLYRATSISWKVTVPYTGLSAGTHTLTVTVLGTKNASSKGRAVVVDAFVVHS